MNQRQFLAPAETLRTGASVPALTSNNVSQAFLSMVHDSLGPGKWGHWFEDGFEWIPFRTLHRVRVDELRDEGEKTRLIATSDFTLGTFTDDEAGEVFGISTANLINQMSPTASCWFNNESKTLHLLTRVGLDVMSWWQADLFVESVQRLVAFAEFLNTRLESETAWYTPASFQHAELGLREEADQLVEEWAYDLGEPEATSGLWFSDEEIRRFIGTMTLADATIHGDDVTDSATYTPDGDRVSMRQMQFDYDLPEKDTGRTLAHVSYGPAQHPELGYGMQRLISLNFFCEPSVMELPQVSMRAATIANDLNGELASIPVESLGLGTWVAWGDQLHHVTYFRHLPLRVLCNTAQGRIGDIMAVLSSPREAWNLIKHFWDFTVPLGLASARSSDEEMNWVGIEENASKWTLWSDRSTATEEILSLCPVNQLLEEPIEVPLEHGLYEFRRDMILASYGIFNPTGPSIGSLEVLIDYVEQKGILVDRVRHPFAPQMHVHAVVDRAGFNSIGQLAGEVLARLEWTTLDWCEIRYPDPEQREYLYSGLYRFAQRVHEDGESARAQANALLASIRNPWSRVMPDAVFPSVLNDDDPWMDWLSIVTAPANIDIHNAYLRSAWEGAKEFRSAPDQPEKASRIQALCMNEVAVRLGNIGSLED